MNRRGFFGRLGAALAAARVFKPSEPDRGSVPLEHVGVDRGWDKFKPIGIRTPVPYPSHDGQIVGIAMRSAEKGECVPIFLSGLWDGDKNQPIHTHGATMFETTENVSSGDFMALDGNSTRVRKANTRPSAIHPTPTTRTKPV